MVRIVIKKLIWDDWNKEHIRIRHNVSWEEVEIALENLIAYKKGKKGRFVFIGRSGKRLISAIISRKAPNTYYIVTARDSDKDERKIVYEKESK